MTDDTQNTTDATRGQHLRQRVESRRAELEAARAGLPEANRERSDIDFALAELSTLMTGDLDNIPSMVGRGLNNWLETSKHVGEHHASNAADPAEAALPPVSPVDREIPAEPEST